jgi:NADH-quinone oxidoreductase subunit B
MVDVRLGPVGGTPYARPAPVELTIGTQRYRLSLVEAGLACCAVEVAAALSRPPTDQADGADESRAADVLVVSGTVTDVLAPAVRALWEAMPRPAYVLSFGACSDSGGPYWDSYAVTNGVDQLIPVDVYIPGCPPRPEALLDGLRRLAEVRLAEVRLAGERA